jgi:hypothetical protein
MQPLHKLKGLAQSHGEIQPGQGLATGIVGLVQYATHRAYHEVPDGFWAQFKFPFTWRPR